MGKRSFLGFSSVASLWRDVFESTNVGDDVGDIISRCGEPDEKMDLGETKIYTWVNEEWKGFLRGGTKTRKLIIVVKDNKVVSKSGQNIEMGSM